MFDVWLLAVKFLQKLKFQNFYFFQLGWNRKPKILVGSTWKSEISSFAVTPDFAVQSTRWACQWLGLSKTHIFWFGIGVTAKQKF